MSCPPCSSPVLEGGNAADDDAVGGFCDALSRGVRAIREASVVGRGGRRAFGHVGAELPAAVRSLRGGRDRGSARPADREGVAAPRAGARAGADAGTLSGVLQRLHGEALPRATGEAAQLQALLHGDQGVVAGGRAGGESQAAGRPPQEAGAPAAAGNAAVPGRLDPSLDRGAGARSRPHRHPRRCHRRDLLSLPGRAGRHDVEPARRGRDGRPARPVRRLLHRPRQPLLHHRQGQQQGRQDAADPGRPRALPTRHHPHPVLFAAGARAHGAGVRDAAEAAAAGAAARPHQDRGGRQPLPAGPFRARPQRPLRGAGRRAGIGLRALSRPAARRRAVRPGGPRGRRRQLRLLAPPQPADTAAAPPPALCPRHRAGSPISRRQPRHLRWAPLSRPLRSQRTRR